MSATLATLELQYFRAVSLYRRRSYEPCVEACNALLQAGHEGNVQLFANSGKQQNETEAENPEHPGQPGQLQRIAPRQRRRRELEGGGGAAGGAGGPSGSNAMPAWLMEGVWQLKMRALTQRVYLDDLEVDDAGNEATEEVEFERIATTARPGSSIKTAFQPRPRTSQPPGRGTAHSQSSEGRLNSARPSSAVARPGTASATSRPASRCGTASRVRATAAAAFNVGDASAGLYQASRLNPTIYAEREAIVKALFQFLYYHEADVPKALELCRAVLAVPVAPGTPTDWWWQQQLGRCLLALNYPRRAEPCLLQSLAAFPHPDTYLLLSRLYQRLRQTERALLLIGQAVERQPFDVCYRLEQARIHGSQGQREDALQLYRLAARLQPINVEALASIAVDYFYDGNPEMALMYYRRILSLGVHNAELYCNIALCCLYGGQLDLVLPCFQRALAMASQPEQRADVWYNLSFVALTSGDFNLARRCLQLCLTSDARDAAALNNLAVLAAHNGDVMAAKSYLNAARDVLPESDEVVANLQYMDLHYKL